MQTSTDFLTDRDVQTSPKDPAADATPYVLVTSDT